MTTIILDREYTLPARLTKLEQFVYTNDGLLGQGTIATDVGKSPATVHRAYNSAYRKVREMLSLIRLAKSRGQQSEETCLRDMFKKHFPVEQPMSLFEYQYEREGYAGLSKRVRIR